MAFVEARSGAVSAAILDRFTGFRATSALDYVTRKT